MPSIHFRALSSTMGKEKKRERERERISPLLFRLRSGLN